MRRKFIFYTSIILFFINAYIISTSNAATYTSQTLFGSWDDAGNWDLGVPPLSNNDIIIISAGDNVIKAGDLVVNNNNIVFHVYGTLTITGTLQVKNNLEFNTYPGGNVIINNFIADQNANLDIAGGGSLAINNLTLGDNIDINVDGTLIANNITTGSVKNFSGSGTVSVIGSCDDGGTGDFCNSGPLPVELLHFEAITSQDDVELLWATASELNNDHFTLERSRNGMGFEIIAQVDGHGTIAERMNYEYIDTNPHLGLSYYRLSQTDYDGTTEVFPLISVLFNPGKSIFTISPNPIESQSITLRSTGNRENELVELNILDLNGKLIDNKYLHADQFGNIEADIRLRNQLKKGIYVFKLISESRKTSSKIIVE